MNLNKSIIAIEGNIGVGKSTFTNILKKTYKNSIIVSEPVDLWMNLKDNSGENILGLFYKDKNRWAYSFQNLAYVTRMIKINEAIKNNTDNNIIFLDRSLGTDKNVFEKMLHDDKILSDIEHSMYNLWCDFYNNNVNNLSNQKIIYLRCDPQIAYDRIKKRGRIEEESVSMEYLQKLHKYHEDWLNNNDNVIIIDCNKDFENDLKYQDEIINKLNNELFS